MSRQGYNDYIGITRQWLRRYNDFYLAINSMKADVSVLSQQLVTNDDMAAPIAKYTGMPGGGNPALNSVESSTARRLEKERQIKRIKNDIAELERVVAKIDRAISSLDRESADIIRLYYLDKRSWVEIAAKYHYSEEWTRKKSNKAIRRMALIIFGVKAMPEQLSFVFAS